LPVHSAHVGQELEVHYRWHPYFGSQVEVRQARKLAGVLYFRVRKKAGFVVQMPAWMFDPVACASLSVGPPRLDWAALVALHELLADVPLSRVSSKRSSIAQEGCHEVPKDRRVSIELPAAGAAAWCGSNVGNDVDRAGQGEVDAGPSSSASGWHDGRGDR
jgi:hypothetical protein